MPIPTPPYVVIGGKRIVCTTYTADDTFEYFVPVEKIAFGADAGTDVDVNTPLPTSDSQTLAELVAFAAANHTDAAAVTAAINAFAAANHTDEAAVTAAVNAFAAAQHADSGSLLSELGVIATALGPLATGARQDALKTSLDALVAANHSDLAAVLAKLTADPATQTTLAAVLAKLTADPSTATLQTSSNGKLDTLHTDLGQLHTDLGATLTVEEAGTYGYHAGTAAATIDVPTGARIKRVSVIPGAGTATVTILGGDTITILQGGGFDDHIPGKALATSATNEVVIAGTVASYYVAWTV